MPKTEFEKTIETDTGMTVKEIRGTPLDELRARAEQKLGKPIEVTGTHHGVTIVSHAEVEKILDKALKK
jgi:hypothetical protein